MARFNFETADSYGTSGGSSFFKLENDRDIARVRLLYNDISEIEGNGVHEVEINGKRRYVECLRDPHEPLGNCPLCNAQYKQIAKVFVKLYDVDTGELKIWDRSRAIYKKLSGLAERYSPLVQYEFEIERHGIKGDKQTTYEFYAVGEKDNAKVEDFLDPDEDIFKGVYLQKSYEDMNYFLDTGEFPDEDARPVARSQSTQRGSEAPARSEAPVTRRTPANRTRRVSEDVY